MYRVTLPATSGRRNDVIVGIQFTDGVGHMTFSVSRFEYLALIGASIERAEES